MRRFTYVGLLFALTPLMASAQPVETAAETLFRAGREAMKVGDLALACERFASSLELKATSGTQLNLAICHERQGELVRSWELFQSLTKALEAEDPRTAIVEQKLVSLRARLALVTLELGATAPEDTIVRDASDKRLPLSTRLAFLPGELNLTIVASSRQPRRQTLSLKPADELRVDVSPGAPLASRPTRAATGAPRGPAKSARSAEQEPTSDAGPPNESGKLWGHIALGVGGVALTVSGISGLLVLREKEKVEQDCSPGTSGTSGRLVCGEPGLAAGDRGKTYSAIGTGAFVVAIASGALGGYLLLSDSMQVRAEVGPQGAGALLVQHF